MDFTHYENVCWMIWYISKFDTSINGLLSSTEDVSKMPKNIGETFWKSMCPSPRTLHTSHYYTKEKVKCLAGHAWLWRSICVDSPPWQDTSAEICINNYNLFSLHFQTLSSSPSPQPWTQAQGGWYKLVWGLVTNNKQVEMLSSCQAQFQLAVGTKIILDKHSSVYPTYVPKNVGHFGTKVCTPSRKIPQK